MMPMLPSSWWEVARAGLLEDSLWMLHSALERGEVQHLRPGQAGPEGQRVPGEVPVVPASSCF